MTRQARVFLGLGAALGLVGVVGGAFGTHALRGHLEVDRLGAFETGVRYQMYHAVALLALASVSERWPSVPIAVGGWLFAAGIVIFSGSLYLLALTGTTWLGIITPLGGALLILGWAVVGWAAVGRGG